MKIFINQFEIKRDYTQNLKYIEKIFEKYSDVDLIVSPELSITNFDYVNIEEASIFSKEAILRIQNLSNKYQTSFYSSFIVQQKKKFFNQGIYFDHQKSTLYKYNKMHLISAMNEDKYFQAGKKIKIVQTQKIKLGLSICYDLRFPEVFRKFAKQEAEVILLVAQWPKVRKEHLLTLVRARAIENQCFFILANGVGKIFKQDLAGYSMIVDPKGEIIYSFEEKIANKAIEISFDGMYKYRNEFPVLHEFSSR